jgi:hypothetical protein
MGAKIVKTLNFGAVIKLSGTCLSNQAAISLAICSAGLAVGQADQAQIVEIYALRGV